MWCSTTFCFFASPCALAMQYIKRACDDYSYGWKMHKICYFGVVHFRNAHCSFILCELKTREFTLRLDIFFEKPSFWGTHRNEYKFISAFDSTRLDSTKGNIEMLLFGIQFVQRTYRRRMQHCIKRCLCFFQKGIFNKFKMFNRVLYLDTYYRTLLRTSDENATFY